MAVRVIDVRERVMERNDEIAADRARAARDRGRAGAQPRALARLRGRRRCWSARWTRSATEMRIAVVTGDVQTQNDADRLAPRTRSHLVQAVVTGGACHLDARQVDRALEAVDLDETDLLLIENVGNLVCPASWDLGEDAKVVLLSVTEGDDKPQKYPKIFRESDYAVITKTDLLPYVPFEPVARGGVHARCEPVHPDLLHVGHDGGGDGRVVRLPAGDRSARVAGGSHGQAMSATAIRPPGVAAPIAAESARSLHVTGVVQGVGFRPFVHRLAVRHGLAGWVRNQSGDVRDRSSRATWRHSTHSRRAARGGAAPRAHRARDARSRCPRRATAASRFSKARTIPTAGSPCRRTWRCARHARRNCSTRRTAATAIRSSRAPTAVRATP